MRTVDRLLSGLALFPAVAAALPARGAETCPFISAKDLAGALPALNSWLIPNQDGFGCIYQAGRGGTMMASQMRQARPPLMGSRKNRDRRSGPTRLVSANL